MDDCWFKQPHLARVRLIGLRGPGEAAHLLCIKQSVYRLSTTHTQGDLLHGNMGHLHHVSLSAKPYNKPGFHHYHPVSLSGVQ